MRRIAFFFFLFIGAIPLFLGPLVSTSVAQTTLVTGKAIDTNGIPYAGAQISAQLVFAGTPVSNPTVTIGVLATCRANGFGTAPCQIPFNPSNGPFQLDSGGNIPGGGITLQDNSLVTPSGTQWAFKINSAGNPPPIGTGPQTCSATITISGASQIISASFAACPALAVLASGAGLGSVTSVSSGNLTPLFTSSVATPSTTPSITYSLSNAAANTVFGNCTGASAPPGFCSLTLAQLPAGTGTVTTLTTTETGMDPLETYTVTNPTTTPNINFAANPVQPGTFLMGPVPLANGGGNPSFEFSRTNTGISTTPTVSGVPSAATTSALLFGILQTAAGHMPAPNVSWTTLDVTTTNGAIYFQNLSSTAPITASSTIASASWADSLAFFGGAVSSIPHKVTLTACSSSGCVSGTLGPITGGNSVLIYITIQNSTAAIGSQTKCTDSVGNPYTQIYNVLNPSANPEGEYAFFSQGVPAGSPVITCQSGNAALGLFTNATAYEVAGLTSYYSGPNGPWNFRFPTAADLQGASSTSIAQYFTQNLGADIAGIANNSTTTLLTQAITFPAAGCPCRAQIMYGAAVSSGNSHLFETWISDGTNTGGVGSQEYVNTGLIYSSTATTIFPNSTAATYGNGQSVTFTLNLGITTLAAGSVTAKQLSPGGRQATWMQISILPTQN